MIVKRRKVLVTALLLDLLCGEPPNRYHPVAWMGTVIAVLRKYAPMQNSLGQFAYGGAISPGGALFLAGAAQRLLRVLDNLPSPLNWLTEAVALKMTLSVR